tara:strand:- start:1596 stop:1709 length:114 start_codon:yes stop_codon:yes gene_type:complete
MQLILIIVNRYSGTQLTVGQLADEAIPTGQCAFSIEQ